MGKSMLDSLTLPDDINNMTVPELEELCEAIRERMIEIVSQNGGHLASNLGTVEMTVAMHKVFGFPRDQVVWDVGHQAYTHKILSGRLDQFSTIRKKDGLSGFPKRYESDYDAFGTGHSSTAISAALGLATASLLRGENRNVIAVLGDGALTGGLAYEGINNAGRFRGNFIVVLNDNKMSISQNVGSMARYLSSVRIKKGYINTKRRVEKILDHIPLLGRGLKRIIRSAKSLLKDIIYKETLFEDMGFSYYGLIDGHDMKALIDVFTMAKNANHPIFIHLSTIKGKGYEFAEKDPRAFHGITSFDIETGEPCYSGDSYSKIFGDALTALAEQDDRICAISAAMGTGTGLQEFSRQYPDRFFDVGIAEGHAVTFSSGLAADGMLPVFAVYSSFLQRGYDQIIHDAAIQKLKVVLAVDRAGVVGDDGETHQGLFDISLLYPIPNVIIYAPTYFDELKDMLRRAVYDCESVAAIRYPRGQEPYRPDTFKSKMDAFDLFGDTDAKVLLVTFGRLFAQACVAAEWLRNNGVQNAILKLNRIKPLSRHAVNLAEKFDRIFFFEEGMKSGGVGESFLVSLNELGYKGEFFLRAVDDCFVGQSSATEALEACGLDTKSMQDVIMKEIRGERKTAN